MNNGFSMDRREFLRFMGGAAVFAAFGTLDHKAYSQPVGIFDTHVHIAVNDPVHYPVGPEFENVGTGIFEIAPTAEDYLKLMDAHGIEQAALIQHDPVYGEDNSYIADTAARYPKRMFAVGRLEANKSDAVETMRYWVNERGLSGFRVNGRGSSGGKSWVEIPDTMRVWETGMDLKIPLALLIGGADKEESLAALTRAMKLVPELQLILDHMGDYSPREDAMQSIDPALLTAADIPNLFIKVSTHNLKRLTANGGSARKAIKTLVDSFGAKRIIWGSDIGNSRVSYPEMIAMAKDAFADLSHADQAMILSGTAKTLYRRA